MKWRCWSLPLFEAPAGLAGYPRVRGVDTVVLAGLATDYCVDFSALDARKLGFRTAVVHRCQPGQRSGGFLSDMERRVMAVGAKAAEAAG